MQHQVAFLESRIMDSIIEIIKAKIDVADEISTVVVLQRSGKSLKGLCPFHNERSPSFYVFRETQTWHCFGCNEGGDIFSFVQKQQGFDFRDTLHYLAEKAGVSAEETHEQSPEEREASVSRERLFKLNEEAVLWFQQALLRSKEAKDARAYVLSRGITSETIQAFSIGYAPDQWDGLTSYLLGRGYTEEELVHGGLARWRESGEESNKNWMRTESEMQVGRNGIYDYFRNRLIFPIRDIRGKVIGFGGRALGNGKPKYLNSPQTQLFEKSAVLYAIDMARDTIKQVGQVIIVEGYVDAVIAHQYGTKQTVACIGSAITEKHIQQLKKLTRQVTLALDPDAAGSAATEQGIQEALKGFDRTMVPVPLSAGKTEKSGKTQQGRQGQNQPRGMIRLEEQVDAEINILRLPDGEDPDEVIRRDFSTWLYAVAHPLPLVDYYFEVKTADLNLREPMGKTQAAERLLPVIAMIRDRVKRDAYIRKLAQLIRVDEITLSRQLQFSMRNQQPGVIADFSGKSGSLHTTERRRDGQQTNGIQYQSTGGNHNLLREDNGSGEGSKNSQIDAEAKRDGAERSRLELDRGRGNTIKWEDYLIGLLLQNPALSPYVCGIITDGDFAGTDTRELYRILNSIYQRDVSPSLQSFETFVPSALLPAASRAIGRATSEGKSLDDSASLIKEVVDCACRLRRARLVQLSTELKYLMQAAAEAGDKASERQLGMQVQQIYMQLRTIDTATHLQG
jgi:DNA primase